MFQLQELSKQLSFPDRDTYLLNAFPTLHSAGKNCSDIEGNLALLESDGLILPTWKQKIKEAKVGDSAT